jgi:HK97 gp10 family phage protein
MKLIGAEDVIGGLGFFQRRARQEVRGAVKDGSAAIEAGAKARVPTKSGKTRRSIRTIFRRKGLEATVGTGYYVARFIHFGTKPHRIKTRKHQALELEVGGEAMYRNSVEHPGIPANPFLERAYEQERGQLLSRFKRALRKAGA